MTPENHTGILTGIRWMNSATFNACKWCSTRCQPVVCLMRFVTCAVAAGEMTGRWNPLKACIARIVYQHPSVRVVSPRTAAQSFADAGVWIQTDGLPQRPTALSGAVQERVFKIQPADESGRTRIWRTRATCLIRWSSRSRSCCRTLGRIRGLTARRWNRIQPATIFPARAGPQTRTPVGASTSITTPITKARPQKKVKSWHGYKLHLQADVSYELPIGFSLKPANESEIKECKELACNMLESELGERCKSFVADKGLDTDELAQDILPTWGDNGDRCSAHVAGSGG